MKPPYALALSLVVTYLFNFAIAKSADINPGLKPGEITLNSLGKEIIYRDITGEKDGIYRAITHIDGAPSLFSGSSHQAYHTLKINDSKILIDCIYTELRSSISGLRITKAVCGLNEKLDARYAEEVYKYTNTWLEESAKTDISELLENKKPLILHENVSSSFDLYEIYEDMNSLESAKPIGIIKNNGLCYELGNSIPYLIYTKHDLKTAVEVRTIEDDQGISIKNIDQSYLEKLNKIRCPLS